MKKIGILFGQENSFPQAFVDEVNKKSGANISAEFVSVDKVIQGEPMDYAVIIDRISQDVPFYRAMLKNAALSGTAVINNPFWWSADEKFFNNALAVKLGIPVPKTVLLPSSQHPEGTNGDSFRNLDGMDWEGTHEVSGYPAYMKPHSGGGWKSVYRLEDKNDFFGKHPETGELVMMLQEEIQFTDYYRCYGIDRKEVRIMAYDPRNPHAERYVEKTAMSQHRALLGQMKRYVIALNEALGYDFNTVEFAVRDGIPYAIDFCNPAPDADLASVGQENFDWVVEESAKMAIRRARAHKAGQMNLTWGTFVQASVGGKLPVMPAETPAKAEPAKKASAAKKATPAKKAAVKKAPAAKKTAAKKPAAAAKKDDKTKA